MTYEELDKLVKKQKLKILGGFFPNNNDGIPSGIKTLILLGPDEPNFWKHFILSPEWKKEEINPLDMWSYRVINEIAKNLNSLAFFPFGTPAHPFFKWAIRSGSAWQSPVSLLVHKNAGLMVSYRGAIGLPRKITLPPKAQKPCNNCNKPCLNACKVTALTSKGYDVDKCKSFLNSIEGAKFLSQGCSVRLSCPISKKIKRDPTQSEYHMSVFKAS
ncbi:ferredoxin [bacterium]|jgi:hypothetical protein|nr:ferredoxin [bacterium]MDC1439653.1 ferredoxin [bacterium]MDG2373800.1 ferredoxin [Paracoccaceae bacterium]|tara:strand:+ start:494 stop:1141 length:648 start_codon:yes stop_codon:yes gene_type:complete